LTRARPPSEWRRVTWVPSATSTPTNPVHPHLS